MSRTWDPVAWKINPNSLGWHPALSAVQQLITARQNNAIEQTCDPTKSCIRSSIIYHSYDLSLGISRT